MELYIEIDENGSPVNHPILKDNLDAAPESFKAGKTFIPFDRYQRPVEGVYEVAECTYTVENGRCKDDWQIRPMTSIERANKQNNIKMSWRESGGFPSWVFDPETCTHKPPVAYPNDNKGYLWDEYTTTWVAQEEVITPMPMQTNVNKPVPADSETNDSVKYVWNNNTQDWQLWPHPEDPNAEYELPAPSILKD